MRQAARTLIAIASTAALVAGCGTSASSGSPPHADQTTPSVASPVPVETASPTRSSPPHFAEMFDIGGGRELFMECTGSGTPTVVFESGDTDDSRAWTRVVPGIVKETRACAYDRLGTGRSDPAAGCRGANDLLGDLEALLKLARVSPPYVLVGTSGGGYLITTYALAHPGDVQGMVIVDTFPAIDLSEAPPKLAFEIGCDNPSNQEHRDYAAVEHAAWDNRRKIGDIPITVISNDYTGYAANADEENSIERQQGWFVLNPDQAKQVIVTTGHDVPGNEPGVVVDEVLRVLEIARTTQP
jgi:alpha/beta hydrolase fold